MRSEEFYFIFPLFFVKGLIFGLHGKKWDFNLILFFENT